ncbi:hypothetical protein ACMA1I_20060 [Pontibacter sp. 13R65]|uniref:hypothetical protein n=1 Tax=Pontibacter sp. 13R65 TaxID=3127458 RepID=UPI00301C1C4A
MKLLKLIKLRKIVWFSSFYSFLLISILFIIVSYHDEDLGFNFYLLLLLGLPIVSQIAAYRVFIKKPKIILLLRPFSEPHISSKLKNLVRDEISFLGFTFTLADKHFTSPSRRDKLLKTFYNLSGVLTSWLSPTSLRAKTKTDIQQLNNVVSSTRKLCWLWLISYSRLLVITASDNFWQATVKLFLDNADLIIVDLSEVGIGSIWELKELKRNSHRLRIIFIASQGNIKNAQELINSFFPNNLNCFFGYRPDGTFVRREEFLGIVNSWFMKEL